MTGANRLSIGVAWGMIALLFWIRNRQAVHVAAERRLELVFLGTATLYAFLIPIKGSITFYDGIIFLSIYVSIFIWQAVGLVLKWKLKDLRRY
jgi:cation:H+ antiporter